MGISSKLRKIIASTLFVLLSPVISLAQRGVFISLNVRAAASSSPAYVTSNTASAGPAISGTQSVACVAGHTLILWVQTFNITDTPTLTTATGNTLAPITGATNVHGTANVSGSAWSVNNCNGTTGNYTYGDSTATFPNLFWVEFSNTTTSAPIDGANTCFLVSAFFTPTCSISTTASSGAAVSIVNSDENDVTWHAATGWTQQTSGVRSSSIWTLAGNPPGTLEFPSTSNDVHNSTEAIMLMVGVK